MNKSPVKPQILSGEAANLAAGPDYIIESTEFRAYIQQKRTEAERKRDDLLTEIERLQVEVQARTIRVTDLDEIIYRATQALEADIRQVGGPRNEGQ